MPGRQPERSAIPATAAVLIAVTVLAAASVFAGGAGAAAVTGDSAAGVGTDGAALSAGEVTIAESGFADRDVVFERDDTVYLWYDEPVRFTLLLKTGQGGGEGYYEVCLRSRAADGSTRRIACESLVLSGGSTTEVTFRIDSWADRGAAPRSIEAVVTPDTLTAEVAASATHEVAVIRKSADSDGDGATTRREVAEGTDFDAADTDGDGLIDGLELDTYGTDPLVGDTDGDGLSDGTEITDSRTDPTSIDTDEDGLSDIREVEDVGTSPTRVDTDGDGLADGRELRVHETDPTAVDTDGDGLVDGAEVSEHDTNPTAADTDEDGLTDVHEIHGTGTDPNGADTDGDGLADGRELHDYRTDPLVVDTDGDGLADGSEVTEQGTDPLVGDTDGDGLADGEEVNAFGTDPLDADSDADGVPDASEVDAGSLPRWVRNDGPTLGAVVALGVAVGFAWRWRRRWIPVIPERARTAARESRLVRRLRSAIPAERVADAGAALAGARRRAWSAAAAARAAAADPGSTAGSPAEADGGHSPDDRRGADGTTRAASADADAVAATGAPPGDTDGAGSQDSPDSEKGTGGANGVGPDTEPSSGAGRAGGIDTASTGDDADLDHDRERVLTPEGEVRAVLRANGGRLKQSEIVDRTGWSKSKVSRTLSRMDDEGTVEKTSIGRGNVISLPDHAPDGARSPFDEGE
ncbi:DUF7343 domain-containing protein [Halobaculum gomorrense]|uniref:IclR helix-turn-helix domain-containing protein n=1 Tax=Halobaculum gomorrense TaxID=43928 RepID=A0A1M5TZM5_9EURY|nr:helix-turn-helix domain-containing protein [Halobaculum gomorrense]SHH56081.1 IclR helix-turn-helix domain-containing protein [Halobaculum gomorrense]